jgi:hypothetical protein
VLRLGPGHSRAEDGAALRGGGAKKKLDTSTQFQQKQNAMTPHSAQKLQRRQFLQTMSALAAGAFTTGLARAHDLPENANPRAIFGDRVEPDWDQRLTITVGPKKADLVGTTDRVIQAAVDYVAPRGGGTVRVLPGTYRLRNSIFLQSRVRLVGNGTDSVLFKEPSVATKLIVDGDHWDQEITLAESKGFQVGDGVRLVSKDPYGKGTNIIQRTLIDKFIWRFPRTAHQFSFARFHPF